MAVNESELRIVLNLLDNASAQLKAALGEVQKKSEEAGRSSTNSFKEATKTLHNFRRSMFVVTAEIGFIIATTKEWSKHNQETKTAYDNLTLSIQQISSAIGSIFAPAIIAFSNLVKQSVDILSSAFTWVKGAYTDLFSGITYGTQYAVAFFAAMKEGVGVMEAHKIATNVAKAAVDEMTKTFTAGFQENIQSTDTAKIMMDNYTKTLGDAKLLFEAGQLSVQNYFDTLTSGQSVAISNNEIIAQQMQDYTTLLNEVTNTTLLNAEAATQSQMDYFNTYKEMYIQGHADMYAFASNALQAFNTNLSTAISNWIMGVSSAKEAFQAFGMAMVQAIVDYLVQQAVAFVTSEIMKNVITATSEAMGAAIASAWAPAAAMVSLATFGANSGPAISGMVATTATAYALAAPKPMAEGGEGIVTQPTLFLAGERGAERYSFTPLGREGFGSNINITLNAIINNTLDIREVAEELGFEIERHLRYARAY